MASLVSSIPTLLGRSVLSPIAPHSLFAVKVEHNPKGSADHDSHDVEELPPAPIQSLLQSCPSLDPKGSSAYRPTPWLTTGHLQTIYSAVGDFTKVDPVTYKRRVILTPDGGTIALDISPPSLAHSEQELRSQGPDVLGADGVPTVVCLHGLTGGSHESYVRNCFSHMTKPKEQGGRGFRGVVVNFRGCANVPTTSPQLYSASKTSDLRSALLFLTHLYPSSPMVGIGFSLGANVLGKYLGEEGDQTPLLGGLIVGTPFDLKQGSDALEYGGFLPNKYSTAMCGNLQRVIRRHKDTLALHPPYRAQMDQLFDPKPLTKEEAERVKRGGEHQVVRPGTLKMVDDVMTRLGGGHWKPYGEFPFETADEYYRFGGSVNFMGGVKRPMLCLNAEDDPIVPSHIWQGVRKAMGVDQNGLAIAGQGNPNIALAWTKAGGHLGWFSGMRPRRWLYKPVSEFCQALFDHHGEDHHLYTSGRSPWKSSEGQEARVLEREIEIELIPATSLPVYDLPGENGRPTRNGKRIDGKTGGDEETPTLNVSDTGANLENGQYDSHPTLPPPEGHSAARMAWLRTHLLLEAPLVHPSQAEKGWKPIPEDWDEERRKLEGYETLKRILFQDSKRPEVGFVELDDESRVGGVGDIFKGGVETPGARHDPNLGQGQNRTSKVKDVIAGL
ncbi:hypothetical protein IE53DRAFT_386855 [Violaceomyces palustris]|uniref:Uncharacterized protein n=1 Tax=Violaceomyces palustris TaxID=1673888 RepID=A0ACD0NYI9_9BASI|nr:hypothetical protein IE53DRAFT_386855 [Violaceomyces palustris]